MINGANLRQLKKSREYKIESYKDLLQTMVCIDSTPECYVENTFN